MGTATDKLRPSLAAKHMAMTIILFGGGLCGNWIASEWYAPKTNLTLPIVVSVIVLALQVVAGFFWASTEECELASRAEALLVEQATKTAMLRHGANHAIERVRAGDFSAVKDYKELLKEIKQ